LYERRQAKRALLNHKRACTDEKCRVCVSEAVKKYYKDVGVQVDEAAIDYNPAHDIWDYLIRLRGDPSMTVAGSKNQCSSETPYPLRTKSADILK